MTANLSGTEPAAGIRAEVTTAAADLNAAGTPPRLAVVAAARAASPAAATSLMTLRLPIRRSCSARLSACSATATTIAGTWAARTRAWAMSSDRAAAASGVAFGSR